MKDSLDPVLVVDLDGTLLRTDVLFESFWCAFGHNWRSPFRSAVALLSGRAALKYHLGQTAQLDVTLLPYDPGVIAYIDAWRSDGGRTALVTASNQTVAEEIARHLGLFDEVQGSTEILNLKGDAKADYLVNHFGSGGYVYMADAHADLAAWKQARKAITVNAPRSLKNQVENLGTQFEHLTTSAMTYRAYLTALRPHQWLKNLLVFLPILVAHRLDMVSLWPTFLAFVAFCLIASSVYVLNDLIDLASDRAHPRKRFRPFASGKVPIAHGGWMAAACLLLGIAVASTLGWPFLLVMAVYCGVTTGYSLSLKRLVVIDICTLACLYTLRILAGGVAANVIISMWLLGFSIFFFLSLAAVKRQAELVDAAERGKLNATGRGYQVADLSIISMIALCSGYVSVLVLALYVNSPAVRGLYSEPRALAGICGLLLYWVTYIVMITHRGGMHDDPVVYAAKDRTSQICLLFIVMFAVAGAVL